MPEGSIIEKIGTMRNQEGQKIFRDYYIYKPDGTSVKIVENANNPLISYKIEEKKDLNGHTVFKETTVITPDGPIIRTEEGGITSYLGFTETCQDYKDYDLYGVIETRVKEANIKENHETLCETSIENESGYAPLKRFNESAEYFCIEGMKFYEATEALEQYYSELNLEKLTGADLTSFILKGELETDPQF